MSKQFFGLSLSIAKAEFKLRHEGSYLGVLWYILNPLLMFLLLLAIFGQKLGSEIQHYPAYLLLGIILYEFFNQITSSSIRAMENNRLLVKSLSFPYATLVSSNVFRTLFSHIFEMVVFLGLLLYFGISLKFFVFYLPILFLFCIFIYGASLVLASLYVYFIDIENIWLFVSRLVFFGTPIFYAVEPGSKLFILNLFNPLFYFMTAARSTIINQQIPEIWIVLGMLGFSIVSLLIGLLMFKKLGSRIPEFT